MRWRAFGRAGEVEIRRETEGSSAKRMGLVSLTVHLDARHSANFSLR